MPPVNETFVALASEWKRRFPRTYDPSGFSAHITPGAASPVVPLLAGAPGD